MIDRNKIAYKHRFDVDQSGKVNKIFNFKTKEFEPLTFGHSFKFDTILVTENYTNICDSLIGKEEIGFNAIGEIVSNPSNISLNFERNYYATKFLESNNIYLLDKKRSNATFIDNIDNILKSNIINELNMCDLSYYSLVLKKENILDIFIDLTEQQTNESYYHLQEYLDESKCLNSILENANFFLKPFNNFDNNEHYLIISNFHYNLYKKRTNK